MSQDIAAFLMKPLLVTTFDFAVSSNRNDVLYQADILPLIKANPIWMNKISGAANIRATVVITLQVNASPYNAGGLLLHFIPNYTHTLSLHKGRNSLTSKSQQPGILMNVATAKEITMEIPYCSPTYFCNIPSGNYDWGRFFVTVWSPFSTGVATPTKCSVSVWMHLIDAELANAIVPQGNTKRGQRGSVRAYKGSHPTEQESKPVSTVLAATSVIASTLSRIPMLTTIAGPVAWFTNVAAGVASSFGWSKPLNENFGGRMIKGSHFGTPNCNGLDQAQPLALFTDNKVRIMSDLGGGNVDQMSINYLKGVYSYGGTFNLAYTDTSQLIYSAQMGPLGFNKSGTTPGTYSMTTIGFLGSLFKLWRGGIVIRFRFFKTQFHTGRIVVAYSPIATQFPALTLSDTAYLHRAIIDLSAGDEACITFPYVQTTDYITGYGGTLLVYVLNPLRGPDAVASNVDVTMEVCGAPDMEFQIPGNDGLNNIVAQMGDDKPTAVVTESIGNSITPTDILGASQYCIGEHVTSLLQMCKRYTRFFLPASNLAGGGVLKIYPFTTPVPTYTAATQVLTACGGGDYISLFASLYVYQRGGVRFRVTTTNSNNYWASWIEAGARALSVFNFFPSEPSTHWRQSLVGKYYQNGQEGGFAVQVPAYGPTYTRFNRLATLATEPAYSDQSPIALAIECVGNTTDAPVKAELLRAAADDFQFAYFIGVPDMMYSMTYPL